MGLRRKIIKLAQRRPDLRDSLLSTLSSPDQIEEFSRRLSDSGVHNSSLIKELLVALIEQSIARGKAEAQLHSQAVAPQTPVVVVQNNPQQPGMVSTPVDPGFGNLPLKPPSEQTTLSLEPSPAPAMPTDQVKHINQYKVNQNTRYVPPTSGYSSATGGNMVPPDLRQLHEIVERFRVLNNVDPGKLEEIMRNILHQMPDNNLRRRLHSYMETAKHEIL